MNLKEKSESVPLPLMAPPSNAGSLDTATLELLAGWRLQDATDNPEDARAAERELAEFKMASNENRRIAGGAARLSVSQFLFLDSGPLGLMTHPQRSDEVIAVSEWLSGCLLGGSRVIVPAIVYYELKRELLRAKKAFSVDRLDAFVNPSPGRYLSLSDEALRLAAKLWAESRHKGRPTAEPKALDIDVLIAARALSLEAGSSSEVVIATTNPKHLSQFVAARHWNEILAGR